jgi:hypothetical protein
VEYPENLRIYERPRSSWEDYIRINLSDIVCEGVHLANMAEDGF